jgi:hypothetical protein
VNWEALVDTYYMWNFTGDPNTQGPGFRAYDTLANNFTLAYAKVAAYMNADPVGFRIDLGYGHTGRITNGLSLAGAPVGAGGLPDPAALSLYGPAFIVQQAYATAKFGDITLDAGKYVTNAADEVLESKANWNYSRSLIFNALPALHTGLRLTLKVNEMVSLQLNAQNGWNNDPDNNPHKTFGGQIALAPMAGTNIFFNTYIGRESTVTTDTQMLFDLIVAYTVSDMVGLSLNGDFFKSGDANWWGAALKARFILSDMFNLALRGEFLQSKDGGYSGTPAGTTGLYEGTVTATVPIRKNYEIRLELRGDFSDQPIFVKAMEMKKNQFTGLIAFLAWLP